MTNAIAGEMVLWSWIIVYNICLFEFEDTKYEQLKQSRISCDVTNTGALPGKEIVQLYVSAKTPEIHRPVRELKGFSKVLLQPGETKQVRFLLTDRDFCVYADGWKSPKGRYAIELGASGRDIRLSETVQAGTVDFDKHNDYSGDEEQSDFNKTMISEKKGRASDRSFTKTIIG